MFPIKLVSFFGTILIWVGVYNLTDKYTFTPRLWIEFVELAIAIIIIYLCHIKLHPRFRPLTASIMLFFTIVAWKCSWNIVDYHITPHPTILRELLYVFIGTILLIATGTFYEHAESML